MCVCVCVRVHGGQHPTWLSTVAVAVSVMIVGGSSAGDSSQRVISLSLG